MVTPALMGQMFADHMCQSNQKIDINIADQTASYCSLLHVLQCTIAYIACPAWGRAQPMQQHAFCQTNAV